MVQLSGMFIYPVVHLSGVHCNILKMAVWYIALSVEVCGKWL